MTITNLPPIYVHAAIADRVEFGRGTLPHVSVSMEQAANALADVAVSGRVTLGGMPVDEQDVVSLMNAMRDADENLTRCNVCMQWTEPGALCDECAPDVLTEQEAWDVRQEKLRDRANEVREW